MNENNEGEESNDDAGADYHSDTQSKLGGLAMQDTVDEADDENLKSLLLKIEHPKITEGMSKKEIYLKKPPNHRIVLNYGPIPGR